MKKSGLIAVGCLLVLSHLSAIAGVDCTKCSCTTWPVEKGCESCCTLTAATRVVYELMNTPERGIPKDIAEAATCVGIVPAAPKKSAFIVGDQYGQGVVTCRTGHGWSAPAFIRLRGGSFGFQVGGQSTDLVLVAMNDKGLQSLLKSKFKIGSDASAAAGPVGRNAQASTAAKMNAELLTYSRTEGVFAGVSLSGAVVDQDTEKTDAFYNATHSFGQILEGEVPPPPSAKPFLRTVSEYFPAGR